MASKQRKRSPSRGWRKSSPKKGSARHSLLKRCGKKCFLLPGKEKFPICNNSCRVSCKGLVAAKVRASQWKYAGVAKRASAMINKKVCTLKAKKLAKSKSVRRK
jgi:hypothetical protein